MFVRMMMNAGLRLGDGMETCPSCGSTIPVVVLVDSEDWSTDLVQLMCTQAHSWLASELEAWHLANVISEARAMHDDFDEMAAELSALQAADDRRRGGLTGPE